MDNNKNARESGFSTIRRRHQWLKSSSLLFLLATTTSGTLQARDKKVLIATDPAGAKVELAGGGMICKAVVREIGNNITPCTYVIDAGAFDPDGGPWIKSKLLGVPLKITLSKKGFRTKGIELTQGPLKWPGCDVGGCIERTYYFVKRDKFEEQLDAIPDYRRIAAALSQGGAAERFPDVTAGGALADCKSLYAEREWESAIQACSSSIGLISAGKPDPDAYNYRCLSNYALKRLTTALQDCEEVTKLEPSKDSAWGNTGLILQALGRPKDAFASFDEALRLNPEYVPALRNRALGYEQLGRITDALRDCEAALKVLPKDSQLLALMVRLRLNNRTTRP